MPRDAAAIAARDRAFIGHPWGLLYLVFTEAWERVAYYGMQSLLVLYIAQQLFLPGHIEHVTGFTVFRAGLEHIYGPMNTLKLAAAITGFYGALSYMTPILGGFIADRFLGRTRTVALGAIIATIGHFLMAFEQSFLPALTCILLGVGLFKGNISSQVGELYGPGDERRGTAFQIFYFVFNTAVIASPLVCGTLGQKVGWEWGFGAAGVSMVIGLIVYLSGRKWLPPEKSRAEKAATPKVRLTKDDWVKVALLVVLLPLLAVSLVGNEEIFNGYLTWGNDAFNLNFYGFEVPSSWLMALDSVVSMITLAGSVAFWKWWATRWREPDELTKIAFAAFLPALGLLALAAAAATVTPTHKASLWWAILFEFLNDIGFANLVPVSMALYARCAPPSINATMIGVYLLQFFIAGMLVGYLAGLLDDLGGVRFWLMHAGIVAAAAVGLLVFWKLFNHRLLSDEPAGKAF
ncbi:oligopeptide:H+ symporter [Asticcacaulis sp. EMRT-3]|uniref:peptide MFS transporter n=1 Tax=Asticcacaulis sp. EMRT-3 TaxID=3040349 RepID=UPI0024AE91AE|nr:oligopeptide:H+ symporter [Asticcacaulis sp. EMRT-3]MDI7774119.1 oligopeptide:H+ symporter [Asticcacaulis sp. EMRT-3]